MDTDIFSRQDAKHAKGSLSAQSGDDDWAKPKDFKRDWFLFVVVSRQTKKPFSAVSELSALICVSLRLSS